MTYVPLSTPRKGRAMPTEGPSAEALKAAMERACVDREMQTHTKPCGLCHDIARALDAFAARAVEAEREANPDTARLDWLDADTGDDDDRITAVCRSVDYCEYSLFRDAIDAAIRARGDA